MNQTNETNETNKVLNWYAIWTRSRHEKYVRDQLAGKGIEPLLPLVKRKNRWKDRYKEVELPLFPGYCFARFFIDECLSVQKARGVVKVIGTDHRPEPIPDEEIQNIRQLMEHSLPYDAHPYIKEGMRVRIIHGPLEGLEGIFLRKGKSSRFVISISLIQQSASLEVDSEDVVPIS